MDGFNRKSVTADQRINVPDVKPEENRLNDGERRGWDIQKKLCKTK